MSLARCGGAFECAACLDASVAKGLVVLQRIQSGKAMLVRIVAMLTKLIRPCRAVCGMRKQDEPLFDQDGSILMNDEGKKPCTEDTVGTEWLKASHKAFGRSIFAHKIAKISKGSGTDFLATQLRSARMLASPLGPSSLRDLCVLLCRFHSCDGCTSEATPSAMCGLRAPGPLGDRTLP